jgi:hypothetical protein
MAEILEHPKAEELAKEKPFDFPDGSSVLITAGEGEYLTVAKAVYMLEDVKYRILQMMREP